MCQGKHCRLQLVNREETFIPQKLKLKMFCDGSDRRYPVKHKRGRQCHCIAISPVQILVIKWESLHVGSQNHRIDDVGKDL